MEKKLKSIAYVYRKKNEKFINVKLELKSRVKISDH